MSSKYCGEVVKKTAMTYHARMMVVVSTIALLALLGAGPAWPDAPGGVAPGTWVEPSGNPPLQDAKTFWDGFREVEAHRLAGREVSHPGSSAALTAWELEYPDIPDAHPTVWIGSAAMILVEPGLDREWVEREARVSGFRWLDESAGLALVEGTRGEDGIDLSNRLRATPWVMEAMPDLWVPRHMAYEPDDPMFSGQWHLDQLHVPEAWDITMGSPDVVIGVIDGGFQMDHPDLAAKFVDPWDVLQEDEDPSPTGDEAVPNHGTAVAGVAAALTDNGEGVAGVCPACPIVPVRLITGTLTPMSADAEAFAHVIDHGAAVVNNSWGYDEPVPVPFALGAVLDRAEAEARGGLGMVVVFAAGNEDRVVEPYELQGQESVVTVGATDRYGYTTAYSNRGAPLDVVAPTGAVTCDLGSGYTNQFGGTSASAPVVAGVVGLAISLDPELTAAEVRELLVQTASKNPLVRYDEEGHHDAYGYGTVDPVALLQAIQGGSGGEDAGVVDAGTGGQDSGAVDAGTGGQDAGGEDGGGAVDTGDGSQDDGGQDASERVDLGPAGSDGGQRPSGGDSDGGCSCAEVGSRPSHDIATLAFFVSTLRR